MRDDVMNSKRKPRAIICIPSNRTIDSAVVNSWLSLVAYSIERRLLAGHALWHGHFLPENRNRLADVALAAWEMGEATHALWLDDDTITPPDTVEVLMSYGVPAVSALYVDHKLLPVAVFDEGKSASSLPDSGLFYGAIPGFGCILLDIERTLVPLRSSTEGKFFELSGGASEDVVFGRKLRALGVPIAIDCGFVVGHAKTVVCTPSGYLPKYPPRQLR